jgi:trehalose-6-phosphate synthase
MSYLDEQKKMDFSHIPDSFFKSASLTKEEFVVVRDLFTKMAIVVRDTTTLETLPLALIATNKLCESIATSLADVIKMINEEQERRGENE